MGTQIGYAEFCSICGTKYKNIEDRFCGNCGEPRKTNSKLDGINNHQDGVSSQSIGQRSTIPPPNNPYLSGGTTPFAQPQSSQGLTLSASSGQFVKHIYRGNINTINFLKYDPQAFSISAYRLLFLTIIANALFRMIYLFAVPNDALIGDPWLAIFDIALSYIMKEIIFCYTMFALSSFVANLQHRDHLPSKVFFRVFQYFMPVMCIVTMPSVAFELQSDPLYSTLLMIIIAVAIVIQGSKVISRTFEINWFFALVIIIIGLFVRFIVGLFINLFFNVYEVRSYLPPFA